MCPKKTEYSFNLKVPRNQAYRKSLQRLRWFRSTFEEQIEAIETRTQIQFTLDPEILTECFMEWIRTIEYMKPSHPKQRIAYVGFASGHMLKHLIVKKPVSVLSMPTAPNMSYPEYFWPEGFVYVAYCLNVRQAVLHNDFGVQITQSPALDKIETWWSFKENVHENWNYAISFLDLFAGEQPNWSESGLFNGMERVQQLECLLHDQLPIK